MEDLIDADIPLYQITLEMHIVDITMGIQVGPNVEALHG
jgi:hypothetical protein